MMATIEVSQERLQEWTDMLVALKGTVEPSAEKQIDTLLASVESTRGSQATGTEPSTEDNARQDAGGEVLDLLIHWKQDGTWDALTQFAGILTAVKSSATAPMAERMGTMVTSVGELAGMAAEPEIRGMMQEAIIQNPALITVLKQVGQWHEDGTWDALTQFAGILTVVKSSATAPMAERVGTLLSSTGSLVSRLTEADATQMITEVFDNQELVVGLLHQLVTWQSNGTWQTLMDLVGLVNAAKDSISVATVGHLSNLAQEGILILSKVLDSGALPGGLAIVEGMSEAMSMAFQEAEKDTKHLTLTGMFRMMKDPQIQISLKTLFGLLKKMPKVLETS